MEVKLWWFNKSIENLLPLVSSVMLSLKGNKKPYQLLNVSKSFWKKKWRNAKSESNPVNWYIQQCPQPCLFPTGLRLKSSSSTCPRWAVVELPKSKTRTARPGIGRGQSRMVGTEVDYLAKGFQVLCCSTGQRRWWMISRRWDGFSSMRYFFLGSFESLWRTLAHSQSYHVSPLLILVHKKRKTAWINC